MAQLVTESQSSAGLVFNSFLPFPATYQSVPVQDADPLDPYHWLQLGGEGPRHQLTTAIHSPKLPG